MSAIRESWSQYRRRMIRETERFIEFHLNHPEYIIEIPAKPVGQGGFPRQVSEWFWRMVLSPKPTSRMQQFKKWFQGRKLSPRR